MIGLIIFSFDQLALAQVGFWQKVKAFFGFPSEAPATGRVAGGAGRGPICAFAEGSLNNQLPKSVTALMPARVVNPDGSLVELQDNAEANGVPISNLPRKVGGFTVHEHPTFWFYLPYISDTPQVQVAQFILLDNAQHLIWHERIAIDLTQTAQMIEYSLPYTLEIGELYNWYFSAICDPEKPSKNPIVRGWVQRIEPDSQLQTALQNANLLQRPDYQVYASSGIWFEAINALAKSRRQFPNIDEFRQDWMGLLAYFGIPQADELDALMPAKIVERAVITAQSQLPARM